MLSIKDKRKKNDDDKLLKHFQNAKFIVCQESNVIIEKTIQFKTKDNNENKLNHKFSENNIINYTTFVEKKQT